jgi:hypothetical protein
MHDKTQLFTYVQPQVLGKGTHAHVETHFLSVPASPHFTLSPSAQEVYVSIDESNIRHQRSDNTKMHILGREKSRRC